MIQITPAQKSVYLLFLANGLLFGSFATRIPTLRDRFDLDASTLGLILLCMALGAVLAMLLVGRIIANVGAQRLSRFALIGMIISTALLAMTPTAWAMAFFLFLFGFTGGGLDVAMNAFGADVEERAKRSLMSGFHGCWSVGSALGAAIGFLALRMDIALYWHLFFCAGLAILVRAFDRHSEPLSSKTDDAPTPSQRMRPTLALILLGMFALVTFMGEGIVMDWGPIYLIDTFDAPADMGSLGLLCFAVAMVVTRFLGDRIIDRIGGKNAAISASSLAALGALTLALAPTPIWVFAGMTILGVGFAAMAPLAFSYAGRVADGPTGPAVAVIALLGYGGLLMGPPLTGFVTELYSLRSVFGGLGIACLLLLLTVNNFNKSK